LDKQLAVGIARWLIGESELYMALSDRSAQTVAVSEPSTNDGSPPTRLVRRPAGEVGY
jgi:hypothetical protein